MKLLKSRKALLVIFVGALLIVLAAPAEAARAPKYSWTLGSASYGDPDGGNGGFQGDPDPGGGGFDQLARTTTDSLRQFVRTVAGALLVLAT
jgi:hypothetical protein